MVLESNPDYAPAYGFMSWATGAQGDLDESFLWSERYIRLDPQSGFPRHEVPMTLVHLQDRERLEELRDRWREEGVEASRIAFASQMLALLDRRFDAMLEINRSLRKTPGFDPEVEQAFTYTYARNYPAAFEAWRAVAPELFEAGDRRQAIARHAENACVIADVAGRIGEVEWAQTLAREVRDYILLELPQYQAHAASNSNLAYCHATLGDFEAATDQLETNLRHRHFTYWWELRQLEMFDPLRGEPRFENVMQAFEDEMARQRARLDRLEAEMQREAGA
jgi:tetratricopeptide (TPR) repeat protein